MFFGEVALADALGARLAHSMTTLVGRLRKGVLIDAAAVRQLQDAGVQRVTIARLDADDVHEDDAAARIAASFPLSRRVVGTGRVNLHAEADGLLQVDRWRVDRANGIDRAITIATLPPDSHVRRGRKVATVKIIDYAIGSASLDAVIAVLDDRPALSVHPWHPCRAWLVQTTLEATRPSLLERTRVSLAERLPRAHATLIGESRCEHRIADLARALQAARARPDPPDWLLIMGASAISDPQDVVPAAIASIGGQVERFGMPVDPGNLILVGTLGNTRLIGLPGCARAPSDNGLDRILARLACGLSCSDGWFATLGVGGLLQTSKASAPPDGVVALMLAAGGSRRFGTANKLLQRWRGQTLLDHSLDALRGSRVGRVLVVTGDDRRAVESVLSTRPERYGTVHNPDWHKGLAASIGCGVTALQDCPAVLVCLADMPLVSSEAIDAVLQAAYASPEHWLVIPVHEGRRGNPVLIRQPFYDAVRALEGDTGARVLAQRFPERVLPVPIDSIGVLQDIDTRDDEARLLG